VNYGRGNCTVGFIIIVEALYEWMFSMMLSLTKTNNDREKSDVFGSGSLINPSPRHSMHSLHKGAMVGFLHKTSFLVFFFFF